MKTKSFDCVELQHRGAALIQEQLKGLTPEEQLEFWRKQTEILREHQEAARARMVQRRSTRRRRTKPRAVPKSKCAA